MTAKDERFAAIKAAMMPQIDMALNMWLTQLSATMDAASAAEVDRCISIVESCTMLKKPEWNAGLRFAIDRLREWKKEAAAENGRKEGGTDG